MFEPLTIVAPPGGWRLQKPPCGVPIDRSHPLGSRLIAALLFNERSGRRVGDCVGGSAATGTSGVGWRCDSKGPAWKFNGTSDYATMPVNLSPFAAISVEFWLWWDAWGNSDNLAMEYGENSNNQNAFYVDPCCGNGYFRVMMTASGGWYVSVAADFARPSAAAWHHYVAVFDRVNKTVTPYLDGVPVSYVPSSNGVFPGGTNFGNSTLYLMSRGGTGLFGAGAVSLLRFYGCALRASDVQTLYTQPYCMHRGGIPLLQPNDARRALVDGSLGAIPQLLGATA